MMTPVEFGVGDGVGDGDGDGVIGDVKGLTSDTRNT